MNCAKYLFRLIREKKGFKGNNFDLYQNELEKASGIIKKTKNDYSLFKKIMKDSLSTYFNSDTKKLLSYQSPKNKFKIVELKQTESDYSLLVESIGKKNNEKLKIYKMTSNKKDESNTNTDHVPHLLLLHGTGTQNVSSILKSGMKPSLEGSLGPGLYMSRSFIVADHYGLSHGLDKGLVKQFSCVFVMDVKLMNIQNRIWISDAVCSLVNCWINKQEEFKHCPQLTEQYMSLYMERKPTIIEIDTEKNVNSEKPLTASVLTASYFGEDQLHKRDSKNRYINSGKFVNYNNQKEFLSHPNLVKPAYLLVIKKDTKNLIETISDIFNHKVFVASIHKWLIEEVEFLEIFENVQEEIECQVEEVPDDKIEKEFTKTNLEEHIFKISDSMLKKEVDSIVEESYLILNKKFKQLSIDAVHLFDKESTESFRFKAALINEDNEDYQFILNSFNLIENNPLNLFKLNSLPKILNVYRITDNKSNEHQGPCMHLSFTGIDSTKLKGVLEYGFSNFQLECFSGNCSCKNRDECYLFSSFDLETEIIRGYSHCFVKDKVRKISYVFLSSVDMDILTSRPTEHLFSDRHGFVIDSFFLFNRHNNSEMRPRYLVVFSIE